MLSEKELKNVFRNILFHNDILCDNKDFEKHLCVSPTRASYEMSPLSPLLSCDFLVSFFLATRFRWQASISQNTVSHGTNPSILSWETRAGEKLSLSEDCRRRISPYTYYRKKKSKKDLTGGPRDFQRCRSTRQ